MRRILDPASAPHRSRLDVATFLARQRESAAGAHGLSELLGGAPQVAALPSAREVAAIVGLALRLEQAPALPYTIQFRPPLHLDAQHLLRPDLALLEEGPRFGATTLHQADGVGLVVEVARAASASQRRLAAYARSRIRDVWSIDLDEGWVEVFRSPASGQYQSRTLWYPGEALAPLAVPDWAVTLLEPS